MSLCNNKLNNADKKKSPSAAGFGSSASSDANEPEGDQACLEVDDWPISLALHLAAIYI